MSRSGRNDSDLDDSDDEEEVVQKTTVTSRGRVCKPNPRVVLHDERCISFQSFSDEKPFDFERQNKKNSTIFRSAKFTLVMF